MKVLHLINTLSAGGAELHLLTLCRLLRGQGIDLGVACLREQVKGSRPLCSDFEKGNIRVINLEADSRYDWRFIGRLARLLDSERPDILHTHLPRADIAGALVRRLTGSPIFLCSVHGIYRDRWFGSWAAPFMRWAYREADVVIAISDTVKSWLNQDLGVSPNRIRVVHYGIEPERFGSFKTTGSGAWKQNGDVVIGSIGRLEAGKGFDCLIRSMQIVSRHVPNSSLLIAGADTWEYGKKLQALIDGLGLTEHVRLVGFQRDIVSFIHALDVFAFASRSEGFGQVAIEAMAAGKPIVASRIPPLAEIIKEGGETGLLVNLDDHQGFAEAIIWLLTHREEARQMGRRGQERASAHFSADRMAYETFCLYDSLLNAGNRDSISLQS